MADSPQRRSNRDRISVCICTYKRPELLAHLLEALARQVVEGAFEFDAIVVDNDKTRSAEEVVRDFAARTGISTVYDCEPERSISLTRNRAVSRASGNLVAFIDDDEWPREDWLVQLHRTFQRHSVDGVLGPVLAHFPPGAPSWVKKGRFFDRRRILTGSRVEGCDARTGNVLLRRAIFGTGENWFDPAFGRTGGEDSDFFYRQWRRGRTFVWCDEAEVYELVPPERWRVGFHVRRLLRAGTIDGELMRSGQRPTNGIVAKEVLVLAGAVLLMVPTLLMPKHIRVRVVQKAMYCVGVVTAYCGLSIMRDRE